MITYYATTPHRYTVNWFVRDWAPELADVVRVVGYSELDPAAPPAPGLHVLTDFERLLRPERRLVTDLYRRLSARPGIRVIGNPDSWLPRYELLRALHQEGINDFRAYRLHELGPQVRFPVFLRWANEHGGSLGDPVRGPRELEERLTDLARAHRRRWRWLRDQLLVVEKVDARSDDGIFRKYSVARIGDAYVPRHVMVSKRWITKNPRVVTKETVAEEAAFLEDPPDLDLIRRVFGIAGIEYGRVDWGYVAGRPQIWEINTNPMFLTGSRPNSLRLDLLRRQAGVGKDALLAQIPEPGDPGRGPLVPSGSRLSWRAVTTLSRRWDSRRH